MTLTTATRPPTFHTAQHPFTMVSAVLNGGKVAAPWLTCRNGTARLRSLQQR